MTLCRISSPNPVIAPVSVIIPCFRCANTIPRAVQSVATQTLKPLEIILVDDASPDDTRQVLFALQEEFGNSWLKIISLPSNFGPGAARNAGWDEAQGDYIAFLDADDAWHTRKIEIQYGWMHDHPNSAITGHAAGFCGESPCNEEIIDTARAFDVTSMMLLLSNRLTTCSAMLRRGIAQRFLPEKRHMEDHLLWLEITLSGKVITILDHTLCYLFKAPFGEAGLSGQMWQMECAELANYRYLAARRLISWPAAFLLCIYSCLKYCRRLVMVSSRRLGSRLAAQLK